MSGQRFLPVTPAESVRVDLPPLDQSSLSSRKTLYDLARSSTRRILRYVMHVAEFGSGKKERLNKIVRIINDEAPSLRVLLPL